MDLVQWGNGVQPRWDLPQALAGAGRGRGWQWEEGVLWLPVSAVAYGAPFLRVVTQSPAVAANLTGIPHSSTISPLIGFN